MVNNFDLIKSLLKFPNDDIYYHLQIIQRKKDCPEIGSNNRVIKSYFICNLETLDNIKEEIIKLCELFSARAYINLTPKSIRKTTLLQIQYLAKRTYEGDFKKIWKSWNSCAGEIKGEESNWIVDIDDNLDIESIKNFICFECEPIYKSYGLQSDKVLNKEKIIAEIPTKNGIHLITVPFNLNKFRLKYPNIDVHKNNPTLLYCL